MRYQDIVVGGDYGLRMRLSSKEPLHHVQVTQKVDRNKHVKVRHVDGESEGMEEFFPFRNIVVPWNRRKQFLRNEESLGVIRELSADVDPVTKEALYSELPESTARSCMATVTSQRMQKQSSG